MTIRGLQLVQQAQGAPADIVMWAMGDLQAELRRGAPGATITYYFNGAFTSSYERPPTIEEVMARFPAPGGAPYRHVALAAWSAGGRAVQRQLEAAKRGGGRMPDAVLLADALHTPLVGGRPVVERLQSVIDFAIDAARGSGRICVIWHSKIPTPTYASSMACADAVQEAVERALGRRLEPFDPPASVKRPELFEALRLGGFIHLGYSGAGKEEHLAEAHMIDEAMQAFVPWMSPDYRPDPTDVVVFPDVVVTDIEAPDADEDALARALVAHARADLGVREEGGHNRGKRVEEYLRAVDVPPGSDWCAAALTTWLRAASAETGIAAPVQGSAGAKKFIAQFQAAGRWIPRADLPGRVRPGTVLVWDRGDWRGHVGVVADVQGEWVKTIEGNAGPSSDAVVELRHSLSEARLLGGGLIGPLAPAGAGTVTTTGTTDVTTALSACAVGIDVSHWKPDVSFQRARRAGVSFAYTKATEGAQAVDPTFAAYFGAMKEAGLYRGAFHYYRPLEDPVEQAAHFARTVGALAADDLPPMLDVEEDDGVRGGALAEGVRRCLEEIERIFRRTPVIYTMPSYWDAFVVAGGPPPSWAARYPLWVAHWTTRDEPLLPRGFERWTFWQYSAKGRVDGVRGDVDIDRFHGSVEELAAWLRAEGSQVTIPGLSNQAMVNAFYRAFGAAYWSRIEAANLTHLAVPTSNRQRPYCGPLPEDLPGLADAEKARLLREVAAALAPR